jgi:hypothetical protein
MSTIFNSRIVLTFTFCLIGFFLALLSFGAGLPNEKPAKANIVTATTAAGWSIVASPSVPGAGYNFLNAVTCVSPSDCWAVGDYAAAGFRTLIEHWNGTEWTIVPSPNSSPTEFNFLNSVACVSATDCWAVGYFQNGAITTRTLIEHWDGTSWTIVPSPDATTTRQNYLNSVTCLSSANCWAVGYYQTSPTIFQTLIERWDGSSWTIVASPNTDPARTNVLYGLTCTSASDCWAVGTDDVSDGTSETTQALAEHWDGTSWSVVPSANITPARNNYFRGVACASAADCWAVDHSYTAIAGQTLTAHWNGSAWAAVSSPNNSPTQNNYLFAVTCASAADCWGIGYNDAGNPVAGPRYQTLIQRWDGIAWTTASSPNTSAMQDNFLSGGTCSATSECWAVGYYDLGDGEAQTLILRYTGNVPTPTSAVSRKTHGAAVSSEINLPLTGNAGIECRSGGATNDYQVAVAFAGAVTFDHAAVTSGTATVSTTSGNGTNELIVNLTGVTNAQKITLTLFAVSDGTKTGDVSVPMNILIGDSTADRFVNSADITQTKSQSGNSLTSLNFREDLNADGNLNSADIALVKSKSGTALP